MQRAIRLLLVEDNADEAELLALELEHAGLTLDWCRVDNDRDFGRRLRNESWDIIISDFSMPRFDGLTAFKMAQQLKRRVPFIFVSGALEQESAAQAMRAGARDYVLKTELDRLAEAVRRALATSPTGTSEEQNPLSLTKDDLDTVGKLAHDFNNLLAIILSYGRFAQEALDENSPAHADMQKVLEAAQQAKRLTGELQTFSTQKAKAPID